MNITFFSNICNPVWADADMNHIDLTCDIDGSGKGLVFTATPDDVMEYGRELHQCALNGEYGEIADYVAPVTTDAPLLQTTRKTAQELSLEAYALQCAVDAGTASDEQVAELAAQRSAIAAMVGQK
ncbi:hypothetical protein K2652_002284 [Salmonella enterica subsp. enterica serovar Agbeni]|nr:hypothetical protein [Salmonella enterica subsp. enterica serovar Agbeni]EHW4351817.1 hypothetical protein [Salmonella enterica subsp. enterica serovar Agbeni]